MGQDGGPALESAAPVQEPPPRLCEAGPCRHYHRMAIQMDAQNPMAERRDGKVIVHARVFHTTVQHYCYPDVGIETNLGSLPVLECNRWVPLTGLLKLRRTVRAEYDRDLADWHQAREDEAEELVGSEDLMPVIVTFTVGGCVQAFDREIHAERDQTLAELVAIALNHLQVDLLTWQLADESGSPITNLDATVNQLGLEHGTRFVITLKSKEIA